MKISNNLVEVALTRKDADAGKFETVKLKDLKDKLDEIFDEYPEFDDILIRYADVGDDIE